mmetsp:Transcript_15818/g.34238  ORF Transcript_15818/g.34238 Transcript_15818/m.34238 type:complete len:109 (-) Transcript_15818:173-499(-)
MAELPLQSEAKPKLDIIPRKMLAAAAPGREVTFSPTPVAAWMPALACIRVSTVSIGWHARTETPPEIQPETKSTQASSDMMNCVKKNYGNAKIMMCAAVVPPQSIEHR